MNSNNVYKFYKCAGDRRKIKAYFRYHHFTTYAGKKGHEIFVRNLDFLENYGQILEGANSKESWVNILKVINNLACNEIEIVYDKISSKTEKQ